MKTRTISVKGSEITGLIRAWDQDDNKIGYVG